MVYFLPTNLSNQCVIFFGRFGGARGGGDRDRFGSRGGGFGSGFGGRGGGMGMKNKNSQPGERLRKPRWDMSRLPKFEKNFYVEHPNVTRRTDVSTHGGFKYMYL